MPGNYGRAFGIGITLNIGFVIIEAYYGWVTGSLALLADAAHNLGDVGGLLLALAGAMEFSWQVGHAVQGSRVWPLVSWALVPVVLLVAGVPTRLILGLALAAALPAGFYLALVFAYDWFCWSKDREMQVDSNTPWIVRGCTYAGMVAMILWVGSADVVPFIYFQF